MTKILLIGGSGQLGKALARVNSSFDFVVPDSKSLDLSKPESLQDALQSRDFDILINAAAFTSVDRAEDEIELAEKINAEAVGEMAMFCQQKGALFCQVSTDYVFGHTPAIPISEEAKTTPISVYGVSKLAGEELVRSKCQRHIIIRTSWLYGPDGHNFLKTMLRLSASGKLIQVVFDQVGTPTFVDHLAEAILSVLAKYDTSNTQFPFGTYHFSNEGVASWYDFAHAIFELGGKPADLKPVRSSAFPTKATRPAYSVLDKKKIKDTFGLDIPHWRDGVKQCLEYMNALK